MQAMVNRVYESKKSDHYISLGDLNLNNGTRCVLVCLLRTWEAQNFKRNNELMSVEFLLSDEKDCLIQGSIHHQLLYKFRENIHHQLLYKFRENMKEGRIFLIRDFDHIIRAGNKYRVTDHQYMIRFTDSTNLEEVDKDNYAICPEKSQFRSHGDLL